MTIENNTHYLRNDYRIESLNKILIGLDNSILSLKKKMEEESWYDGLWFLEEVEPIYGLAFIAMQNYINCSIKDFTRLTICKEKYYKIDQSIKETKKSHIELIIGLANYSKHKEEKELHKGTREILESFNLSLLNEFNIEKSPIFEGLSILNNKWDLFEILNIVANWREKLWTDLSCQIKKIR